MSYEELDRMVAAVRELGALPADTAREVAPDLEAAVRATAAAGTSPDGQRWSPTKTGSAPLQNAAQSITVRALGTVVQFVVSGYHAVHNRGTKRLPRRQIIPGALSPSIARAVRDAAERVFRRTVGGP